MLTHLAVSSPGVVLGRAIRRHWKKALQENFSGIVSASWKGLRSRFDEPWIARALRRPQESFPAAGRRAVLNGNLEATLDEHFWFITQTSPSGGEDLIQEFADAISLNRSSIQLHYGEKSARRSPLRANACATVALSAAGLFCPTFHLIAKPQSCVSHRTHSWQNGEMSIQ